jgi:hypothetical protein
MRFENPMTVNILMVRFCVLVLAVWNCIGQPTDDCQLGLRVVLTV